MNLAWAALLIAVMFFLG